LEESVGEVEREAGAVALLPDFEIVEQAADVGERSLADLGSGAEVDLAAGFQVKCL
jgi:hypothetical protein